MADSREIGMRVGAATNQAVSIAVAAFGDTLSGTPPKDIAGYVGEVAAELLAVMDGLQAAAAIGQNFTGTTTVVAAPVTARATIPLPVASAPVAQVAAPSGYNTQFSGSNKPLKLAEHPELDGWLQAQAAAKGVTEVWDNRGKANFLAAIASGAVKTPPPFRSATEGNDTSFWPPK